MSTIKIKRSGVSGSPSFLGQGELAYSYLLGSEINGGDRLFIGTGVETDGQAANIEVIGGAYFTNKMDHTPGILTANSAIITDSNSKINELIVDNLRLDGNSLSSTDLNGNIIISPNGSGSIDASISRIINVGNPQSAQDAATKNYVDSAISSISPVVSFSIEGNIGTDSFTSGETLGLLGGTGITSEFTANNVLSFNLDDTTVSPGVYGSANNSISLVVDQQGRITSALNVPINHDTLLNFSSDEHIAHSLVLITAGSGLTGGGNISASRTISVVGGTGVTANSSGVHIGQSVSPSSNVTFNNLTLSGDLLVQGSVTTVNSTQVNIGDNIIILNAGETGVPSLNAGFEIERGLEVNKSFLWNETLDKWTIGTDSFIAGTFEGNLIGNVTGNLTGIATSANVLTTSRQISIAGAVTGSASFNGSSNITINAVLPENSVTLGLNTVGNYVGNVLVAAGTGLSISGSPAENAAFTLSGIDATSTVKGVASFSANNFIVTAGMVEISELDGGVY